MKFRWSLVELKLKLLQAKLLKNKEALLQYQSIINQYQYNENLTPKDFLMSEPAYDLCWCEAINQYASYTNPVDDTIFDIVTDLFIKYGDSLEIFENSSYTPLYLSNDALVEEVYNILISMNAADVLEFFEELVYKRKINIIDRNEILKGNTEEVAGITFKDSLHNISYINLFRNYTVQDIDSLVHETMHAYFNRLLHDYSFTGNTPYLMELEGEFGSMYATDQMAIKGYPDTNTLINSEIDFYLQNSYITLITSLLFITGSNRDYNLDALNNRLEHDIKNLNIIIRDEDVPNFLGVNQYECFANTTAYLTAIDLMKTYSTPEIIDIIGLMKLYDGKDIIGLLDRYGVTFHRDGLENFNKRYTLARKNTH